MTENACFFFWELAHHRSFKGQSLSHLNLERKIPNGQFPNHRDSKNANICTAAVTKKRFHVYNKTDHKPQVSQKGQEKMWAKNRDRKQCQKEEFYCSSSPVDAIELLI